MIRVSKLLSLRGLWKFIAVVLMRKVSDFSRRLWLFSLPRYNVRSKEKIEQIGSVAARRNVVVLIDSK
jgi:hypothetical protein